MEFIVMRYLGFLVAILAILFLWAYVSYQENLGVTPPANPNLEVLTPENAQDLQQLARYGNGLLTQAAAWSPDGQTLAVGGSIGIWFFDISHPEQEPTLHDLDTAILDLVYTSDGNYLAYETSVGVDVIEIATGEGVLTIDNANEVVVYPDTNQIVVGKFYIEEQENGYASSRAVAEIWDIESQQLVQSYEPENIKASYMRVNDLEFSHDGRYLAVSFSGPTEDTCGHRSATMQMWDLQDPEQHPITIGAAEYGVFSADNSWLISMDSPWMYNGADYLRPYKIGQGELEMFDTAPELEWGYTSDFAFHPQSGELVTVTESNLSFWEIETQTLLSEIPIGEEMRWLSFNPNGNIAVTHSETSIQLWTDDFSKQQHLPFDTSFEEIQFLKSGAGFTHRDAENRLHVWHVDGTQLTETFVSEPLEVDSNAPLVNKDGTRVAYTLSQQFQVWNILENQILNELPIEPDTLFSPIAFSDNGQYLLTKHIAPMSGETQQIYLQVRDSATLEIVREFGSYEVSDSNQIVSSGFSDDGTRIYLVIQTSNQSVGWDYTFQIFDIASGTILFQHSANIKGGMFTPDLSYLLLNLGDYSASAFSIYDVALKQPMLEEPVYSSYGGGISSISDNGQYLTFQISSFTQCGGDFRQVFVHEIPSKGLALSSGLPPADGSWRGEDGKLNHDGSLFYSVDTLYSTETGEEILKLPFGRDFDLTFTADGTRIVVNQEGTIRIWGVVAEHE
jgi:WD40 repeat protein